LAMDENGALEFNFEICIPVIILDRISQV
jgi:hypothetical protein